MLSRTENSGDERRVAAIFRLADEDAGGDRVARRLRRDGLPSILDRAAGRTTRAEEAFGEFRLARADQPGQDPMIFAFAQFEVDGCGVGDKAKPAQFPPPACRRERPSGAGCGSMPDHGVDDFVESSGFWNSARIWPSRITTARSARRRTSDIRWRCK